MMNRKIVLGISIVFLVSGVSASSLSPQSYSFDIVAGENYTQELTLNNTDSYSYRVNLSTNVSARSTNTEGINVSHSTDSLVVEPHSVRVVRLYVNTSPYLKPDTFTFETNFTGEKFRDRDGDGDEDPESFSRNVSEGIGADDLIGSEKEELGNHSEGANETSKGNESENQTSQKDSETDETDDQDEMSALDSLRSVAESEDVRNGVIAVLVLVIVAGVFFRGKIQSGVEEFFKSEEERNAEDLPKAE